LSTVCVRSPDWRATSFGVVWAPVGTSRKYRFRLPAESGLATGNRQDAAAGGVCEAAGVGLAAAVASADGELEGDAAVEDGLGVAVARGPAGWQATAIDARMTRHPQRSRLFTPG